MDEFRKAQVKNTQDTKISRTILIILDGVGCGELPDAAEYGDSGSNTLGNLSKAFPLTLPTLETWGLGHLTSIESVKPLSLKQLKGSFGKCQESSAGKDTTTGHWEMAGIEVKTPFQTFPNGFSADIVDEWIKITQIPGVLWNKAASGTEIIQKLGEEHLKTGKPILYTSADSVWQIAAHEEKFGLEKLYKISEIARKICDRIQVSRVIARPFTGTSAENFKRTHHRKDFSILPPKKTMMELLEEKGISTIGIGKISNIYAGRGIKKNISTIDNTDGMRVLKEVLNTEKTGLIFLNLIDFDMNYGHRRDVPGFANALSHFDQELAKIEPLLTEEDLVLISADHGNDPTYKGTDHTREYVPLLAYRKNAKPVNLGIRTSFADIGQTICHALTGTTKTLDTGTSFFNSLCNLTQ